MDGRQVNPSIRPTELPSGLDNRLPGSVADSPRASGYAELLAPPTAPDSQPQGSSGVFQNYDEVSRQSRKAASADFSDAHLPATRSGQQSTAVVLKKAKALYRDCDPRIAYPVIHSLNTAGADIDTPPYNAFIRANDIERNTVVHWEKDKANDVRLQAFDKAIALAEPEEAK